MHGANHPISDDHSKVFFIEIIARRLLFWAAIQEMKQDHRKEAGVYARLEAEQPAEFYQWNGIEFGNIEEGNQEPLAEHAYAELLEQFNARSDDDLPWSCISYVSPKISQAAREEAVQYWK